VTETIFMFIENIHISYYTSHKFDETHEYQPIK